MSQKKESTVKGKRNSKGQFQKGNTEGKKFEKDNEVALKFKEEYCDLIIEYFSKPPTRVEYKETYYKGELTSRTPIILPEEYPTFERFAAQIGVSTGTLKNWCEKNRRFADCYARAKEIQLGKLTSMAVIGVYNPIYAKFEAVNNHNQKDKQEVDTKVAGAPVDEKTLKLIERVEKRLNAEPNKDNG